MRLHRIFNILVSVSIIIAGICLMLGALRIYYNYAPPTPDKPFPSFVGAKNYSREMVAETFGYVAVPVYICLGLTLGSFIFELFSPLDEKKKLPKKKKAEGRSFATSLDKKKIPVIKWCIVSVCCIVFLIYGLNPANFMGTSSEEITSSVIRGMIVMIPCLAVAFAACLVLKPLEEKHKMNKGEKADTVAKSPLNVIRWAVVVLGIVLLLTGLFMGGTRDVLTKAVNICTECIGLG